MRRKKKGNKKKGKLNKLQLLSLAAVLLIVVFMSACVELLQPTQSASTTVNMTINSGSTACAGYQESTCGAFVKDKRVTLQGYVCTGYNGTLNTEVSQCIPCPLGSNGAGNCSGTPCLQDADCPTGVCGVSGRCIQNSSCTTDSDCEPGALCVNGSSTTKGTCIINEHCQSIADCPNGYSCTNGECIAPDITCSSTTLCNSTDFCDNGQCIYEAAQSDCSKCGSGADCHAEETGGGAKTYDLPTSDGWQCVQQNSFSEKKGFSDTNTTMILPGIGSKTEINQTFFLPSANLNSVWLDCTLGIDLRVDSVGYELIPQFGDSFNSYNLTVNMCDMSSDYIVPDYFDYGASAPVRYIGTDSLGRAEANISNLFFDADVNGVDGPCRVCEPGEMGLGHVCDGRYGLGGNSYITITCTPTGYYNATWACSNPSEYGTQVFNFNNCSAGKNFKTFQGGVASLETGIPFSSLSNTVDSYYSGNTANNTQQVPFFMIGQGPTFADYEVAKPLCTPFQVTVVNVSLGNTTFSPPNVTVAANSNLCLNNIDTVTHKVTMLDSNTGNGMYSFSLNPKQTNCTDVVSGQYTLSDSNGDTASINVPTNDTTTQYYVGSSIFPDYGVVTLNGVVNFTLIDMNPHTLNATFLSSEDNPFMLNLSVKNVNWTATSLGQYKIIDNTTNSTAGIFVESPTYLFTFLANGSVSPDSGFIARPLGDSICFTSETSGVTMDVYEQTQNGLELLDSNKEIAVSPADCCIDGILAGSYIGVTNDNRNVSWLIGSETPQETIHIQGIGFVPESTDSAPGVQVCWVNPTMEDRTINTVDETEKQFFSAVIPGLSSNVCTPPINNTGAYTTSFLTPPVNPKHILDVENLVSRNINVMSYGFDPQYTAAQPGDNVCWTNIDTRVHVLTSETGNKITLQPKADTCINDVEDGKYYSMTLDTLNITSVVTAVSGSGAIVTPFGISPSSLIVPLSNSTWTSTFRIINDLSGESADLTSDATVTISVNQTYPTSILAFAPLNVSIGTMDSNPHTIGVYYGDPTTGYTKIDDIIVSGLNFTSNNVTQEGSNLASVVFTRSGELVDETVLTQLLAATCPTQNCKICSNGLCGGIGPMTCQSGSDCSTSKCDQNNQCSNTCQNTKQCQTCNVATHLCGGIGPMPCNYDSDCSLVNCSSAGKCGFIPLGTSPQTSALEGSTVTIEIPQSQVGVIVPGASAVLSAPNETESTQFNEQTTGSQLAVTFSAPTPSPPTVPFENQTIDLPTQTVSGPLSSDTLAQMRAYADSGVLPMIIPSFRNVKVDISSSSFSPTDLNVTAGSTITWINTDNVPHNLTIIENSTLVGCSTASAYNGTVSCTFNQGTQSCNAMLISPTTGCQEVYEPPNCIVKQTAPSGILCSMASNGNCMFDVSVDGSGHSIGCKSVSEPTYSCTGYNGPSGVPTSIASGGAFTYTLSACGGWSCTSTPGATQTINYPSISRTIGNEGSPFSIPNSYGLRYMSAACNPSVGATRCGTYGCYCFISPDCGGGTMTTYNDNYCQSQNGVYFCSNIPISPNAGCNYQCMVAYPPGYSWPWVLSPETEWAWSPPSAIAEVIGLYQSGYYSFSRNPATSAHFTCQYGGTSGSFTQNVYDPSSADGYSGYGCYSTSNCQLSGVYTQGSQCTGSGGTYPFVGCSLASGTCTECNPTYPVDTNIGCTNTGTDCITTKDVLYPDDGSAGGPFCNKIEANTIQEGCSITYPEFAAEGVANCIMPAGGGCVFSKNSPMLDPAETPLFCALTFTSNTSAIKVYLNPGDSYNITNVPKNTTFFVTDVATNVSGIVNSLSMDASVSVGYSNIQPVEAEVATGAQLQISNFDNSKNYTATAHFVASDGTTNSQTLYAPAFGTVGGLPGISQPWVQSKEGNAILSIFSTQNNAPLGNVFIDVSNEPQTFQLGVSKSGFNISSLQIGTGSKVCFSTDVARTIRITDSGNGQILNETMIFPSSGTVDPATISTVCSDTLGCVAASNMAGQVACSGIVNGTNQFCNYTVLDPSIACEQQTTSFCSSINPDFTCPPTPDYSHLDSSGNPYCTFEASVDGSGYTTACPTTQSSTYTCTGYNGPPADLTGVNGGAGVYLLSGCSGWSCSPTSGTTTLSFPLFTVTNGAPFSIQPDTYGLQNMIAQCTDQFGVPSGSIPSGGGCAFDVSPNCNGGTFSTSSNLYSSKWNWFQTGFSGATGFYGPVTAPYTCTYNQGTGSITSTIYNGCSCFGLPSGSYCSGENVGPYSFSNTCSLSGIYTRSYTCTGPGGTYDFVGCTSSGSCSTCGKKPAYDYLDNFACPQTSPSNCPVTSNSLIDDIGWNYCQKSSGKTCVSNGDYQGVICSGPVNGQCTIAQSDPKPTTNRSICELSIGACTSNYPGVNCSLDSTTDSCNGAYTGQAYCFSPGQSTYTIEDVNTGNSMVITGYDKRTSLNVNLKDAYILPSSVTTSPGSEVCFQSTDGFAHNLTMPSVVNNGNILEVPSSGSACVQFPGSQQYPFLVSLNGMPGVSTIITSIETNSKIDVVYKLFNPDAIIVRPGSTITFNNKDKIPHVLFSGVTEINSDNLLINNSYQSSSGFNDISINSAAYKQLCKADSDCPSNNFCTIDGLCRPIHSCLIDNDCPTGSLCDSGICTLVKQCSVDSDCKAGDICLSNGLCSKAKPSSCANGESCPAKSVCGSDNMCYAYINCSSASDCPAGDGCKYNVCTPPVTCSVSSQCPSGSVCNSGSCVTQNESCITNSDCAFLGNSSSPYSCGNDGFCHPTITCIDSSYCPSGQACTTEGNCTSITPCSTDNDCLTGSICSYGGCMIAIQCTNDTDCTTGSTCLIPTGSLSGLCSVSGSGCTADSDCPSGDLCSKERNCFQPVQYKTCQVSGDCGANEFCSANGLCEPAPICNSGSNCGSGFGCGDYRSYGNNQIGSCLPEVTCSTNSNCPSGSNCDTSSGKCRSEAAHCSTDADCPLGGICSASGTCTETVLCDNSTVCQNLQNGAGCETDGTNGVDCISSSSCFSDSDCSFGSSCSIGGICTTPIATACGGAQYGSNIQAVSATFNLSSTTQTATLYYQFNDNGKISINGYNVLSNTLKVCKNNPPGSTSYSQTYPDSIEIPPYYLNLGKSNTINITMCSCEQNSLGANLLLSYSNLSNTNFPSSQILCPNSNPPCQVNIPSSSQTTINVGNDETSFSYVDNRLFKSLSVSVKNCTGADVGTIANQVGQYERSDYNTLACDTGVQQGCSPYNPYGPASVAIFTTEEGLNMSNQSDLACAESELNAIEAGCPNCTSALNVGEVDNDTLAATLNSIKSTNPSTLTNLGLVANTALVNDFPTCDIGDVMNNEINLSKLALYDYNKTSILAEFGIKEGPNALGTCNWTNTSIISAYNDFYGIWIPLLAGAGTVGVSQHCLTDACPMGDYYGLLTTTGAQKDYTSAWFQSGCGEYYYDAQGLSLDTFSPYDTNYSLCDPSRMLAVLQSAACEVGNTNLKTQ